MSIKIESTTDNEETVTAASGDAPQKPVEETPETPDKDAASAEDAEENTEEADASDNDETDAEEGSEGDEEESESKEAKPKKVGGYQRKINKLTKKAAEALQEKEYWRQEALKAQKQPVAEKSEEKPQATSDKPLADNFETHEDYVEALTDWKLEQKLSEREAKAKETQAKTEHQSQIEAHIAKVNEFKATVDDFDDVIEDVEDIPMSLAVQDAILTSDNGPELMYQLAKNPDEYRRICQLPAMQAARAIGRFESRIQKESPAESPAKQPKTTKAPPPLKPVGKASSGTVKKDLSDPNISQREFERIRAEQEKQRAEAW